ncbi:m7gpppn-mRNA hydrolase like protein [Babesia gibsoni]|uniref:M7gpppn-mRNA hydrolase like protein n=1 Tax=Babesia gibsoni TaxID=33632 RepID=A0AAD8PGE7_BABGI|nr:m7gpppn-mRNA hydrolase like protein [Babesia gibsoni]
MKSGVGSSGSPPLNQLADELCMTLKNALGVRGQQTHVESPTGGGSVNHVKDGSSVSGETVADSSPPRVNGLSMSSSPLVKDGDDLHDSNILDDVSESRLAYLQENPLVDAVVLDKALSDCYGRFVALLPDEVLCDHVHLCFYLQEAYWWYSDKWVARYPEQLVSMTFGAFLSLVCEDCPLLRSFITPKEREQLLSSWKDYSKQIPLRGGILLNETCDKVLLVQCYRSHHWTFPRGKTDESEVDSSCAAREIKEEVGLDVKSIINDGAYIEREIDGRSVKLFIIPGINENDILRSKTEYEIKKIKWVPLTFLSDILNNKTPNFVTFHVRHFVKDLWAFVKDFRSGKLREMFPKEYKQFLKLNRESVTGNIQPSMTFRNVYHSPTITSQRRAPSIKPIQLPRNRSAGNLKRHQIVCEETFGEFSGWSADEMFRVNREKFGVESTYKEQEVEGEQKQKNRRELIPFDS